MLNHVSDSLDDVFLVNVEPSATSGLLWGDISVLILFDKLKVGEASLFISLQSIREHLLHLTDSRALALNKQEDIEEFLNGEIFNLELGYLRHGLVEDRVYL